MSLYSTHTRLMDAHHQSRRDEIKAKAKRITRNSAKALILRSEKRGLMYDPHAQYASALTSTPPRGSAAQPNSPPLLPASG